MSTQAGTRGVFSPSTSVVSHKLGQTGPEPKHRLRGRFSTGDSGFVTLLLQEHCLVQSHNPAEGSVSLGEGGDR